MWCSWTGRNPARPGIEYRWHRRVTLTGSRIWFFADQPAGASVGVAPPRTWHLEYWDKGWQRVRGAGPYGAVPGHFQAVAFPAVTTRCRRAAFGASGEGAIPPGRGGQAGGGAGPPP